MPDLLQQIGEDSTIRQEFSDSWGLNDLRYYNRTESTQSVARALADAGASGWTLIVADHQSAGVGREGKEWVSQPGTSVLFSLLLRPERPEAIPLLPVRTGLILADALDELLTSRQDDPTNPLPKISLKWPNDLMIDNGKIGGILVEGVTRGSDNYVLLGIGINVFRFVNLPGDYEHLHIRFLDDYVPKKGNRLRVLERMVTALRERLRTVPEDLMPSEIEAYAMRDWLRGKRIVQPQPGVVAGINRKGYLLLENEKDETDSVVSGSIVLEKP